MQDREMWKKKLAYYFDEYMEKGVKAQFGLLFAVFISIIILAGGLVYLVMEDTSFGSGMWQALMHLLDQGTITGDEVVNYRYLLVMLLVTFAGMVLTGSLIAIITNALEDKLEDLRKGHSQLLEEGHTVLIGFDENIYGLLKELVHANENSSTPQCIVIVDEALDKETMDKLVGEHIDEKERIENNTKLICRSGKLVHSAIYTQISLVNAKSVIINNDNDFEVLRILLAVTNYLRRHLPKNEQGLYPQPIITTLLHEERSVKSAEYVVKDFPNAKILFFEGMLARIIAQVCRQPGLSAVLSEVFGYVGNEFYIEARDRKGQPFNFAGQQFSEVLAGLTKSVAVGIKRGEELVINPDGDMPMQAGDEIVHLAKCAQAGEVQPGKAVSIDKGLIQHKPIDKPKALSFLILDWNEALPLVIESLDQFVEPGSSAVIVSDRDYLEEHEPTLARLNRLENFAGRVSFKRVEDLYDYNTLTELLQDSYTNILLVCRDSEDKETADAQAAMLLLHLRAITNAPERRARYEDVIITSEMNTAEDQKLLQVANIHDFVVGSEITNRIMAQVSRQPKLKELFDNLLSAEGSEIYLRPVSKYIRLEPGRDVELTFDQVTELVHSFREADGSKSYDIPLGYKLTDDKGQSHIHLNPKALGGVKHRFKEGDRLVILAKGK